MPAGWASDLASYRPIEGPLEACKREQSRLVRRRLYRFTVFYTTYSLIVAMVILRGRHPLVGIMFCLAGVPAWTLGKNLFHRYVLHEHFPLRQGLIRRFLHERPDALHREDHERALDESGIGGRLKDILPLFCVAAPFSFLFPVGTLPALLAGVVQSCVGEEWAHYFLHFGKFRNRLFRRLKRYHLRRHSLRGMEKGYGINSPNPVRRSLSKGTRDAVRIKKMTRSEALRLFRDRFKQRSQ